MPDTPTAPQPNTPVSPDWRPFWQSRWDAGQIGFHRPAPNPHLVAWFDRALGDAERGRVLVPLCGKSIDLAWLETHFERVVGVEYVPLAARDFAASRPFPASEADTEHGLRVRSGATDIHVADFFALSPETFGPFDAAYDRAALIALPRDLRARYASALAQMLADGAPALIITFAYPEHLSSGPPFSVTDAELESLLSPFGDLTRLVTEAVHDKPAALASATVTTSLYRFVRRTSPNPTSRTAMTTVTFKGTPVETSGTLPALGSIAPAFTLVASDLSELSLADLRGKPKVLNVFPSLDTSTCALSVRRFNAAAAAHPGAVVLNISADLPFAHRRFCTAEGITSARNLSTFRSTFTFDYGLRLQTGPLAGLASRAVLVLDADDRVVYAEQVAEIAKEPNYDAALAALSTLKSPA